MLFFVFFKQKTAYEMRISDWSSDVCSSDLPVSLVLWWSPRSLYTRNAGLRTVGIVSCMVIFGMLYLAAMEYFFFDEFNARFNLVAVDYLIYPTETLGNIRDTYPLGAISSGLIALTLLTAWALWRWLKPEPENVAPGFARRSGIFALHLAVVVAISFVVRADSLEIFGNRAANQLADNGPANFFSAFRRDRKSVV